MVVAVECVRYSLTAAGGGGGALDGGGFLWRDCGRGRVTAGFRSAAHIEIRAAAAAVWDALGDSVRFREIVRIEAEQEGAGGPRAGVRSGRFAGV